MDENILQKINIVPISEEYIESFHKCLNSVAEEKLYLAFIKAPPLTSTREFVLFNIKHKIPQYIATKGSEVVGWCDILPMKYEGLTHSGRLGMGVKKEYRGQGIGKRLMDKTMAEAKKMGIERVELEVFASNRTALRFYKKSGFEVEGVKKRHENLIMCMMILL